MERSKRDAQHIHASRRAAERFGVFVEPHTYKRIIREIQDGTAKFCWRTSKRVTVFQTELAGKPCRVAYDRQRKQIVTFMTVEEGTDDCAPGRAQLHRKDNARKPVSIPPESSHREVQRAG